MAMLEHCYGHVVNIAMAMLEHCYAILGHCLHFMRFLPNIEMCCHPQCVEIFVCVEA